MKKIFLLLLCFGVLAATAQSKRSVIKKPRRLARLMVSCPKNPQLNNTYIKYWGLGMDNIAQLPRLAPIASCRDTAMTYFNTADQKLHWWTGVQDTTFQTLTAIGGGDTIVGNNIERGGTLTKNTLVKYNDFVPQIAVPNPGTGDGSWVLSKVFSPRAGTNNLDWIQTVESINTGQFDTSHNEVMKWGWNINRSIKTNAPGEHYAMESNYNPFGTGRYMENHLEIATPDGLSTRLFSNTTTFTSNDQSIASSQWDFRQSKFNFFDIQGTQCITATFATGQSLWTQYWDQLVDATQFGMGWSFDGTVYRMNNNGGGAKELDIDGWNEVNMQNANAFLAAGVGICRTCAPGGGTVIFGNDIRPAGNVGDTSNIGTSSFQFRNSFVKNGFVQRLKVADDLTTSPDASAQVDVTSTTRGFLPPRMTTTQKNAIASPAEGLVVYDLTLHKLSVWTGSAWETVTSL